MDPRRARAGFVLVGGRSSRMGTDKALLPHRGRTLVECVAEAVLSAAGSVTLVGPECYRTLGFVVTPDTHPGAGPLGGIHAALAVSDAAWNVVVACDMPEVTSEVVEAVLRFAENSDVDCAIPHDSKGRPEPLCAAYHLRCLEPIAAALERGVRKIADGLAGLRQASWTIPDSTAFENVNTPADWDSYLNA